MSKKEKTELAKLLTSEKDAHEFMQSMDSTLWSDKHDGRNSSSLEKVKSAYKSHRQKASPSSSSPMSSSSASSPSFNDSNFVRKSSLRSPNRSSDIHHRTSLSSKRVRFAPDFAESDAETIDQILYLLRTRSFPSLRHNAAAHTPPRIISAPSVAHAEPMQAERVERVADCISARLLLESDEAYIKPSWQPGTAVLLNREYPQDEDLPIIPDSLFKSNNLHRSDARRVSTIPKRPKLLRTNNISRMYC